jgi:uncharacterized repeat protein (TIGR01451 family)
VSDAADGRQLLRLNMPAARALLVALALLLLGTLFPSLSSAQTSVTNIARITPPSSVFNTNPSVSCTSGVCQAGDTDTVTPSADLQITKTASVSAATVGQTFSYVITFANAGPSAAADITLTDALTGLTLVRATSSVGTLQTTGTALTVTQASLASGGGGTITLTVQVSSGSGSITNAVSITSTTPDPTPGNNTSTTVTSRIDSADLQITKTASVSAGHGGPDLQLRHHLRQRRAERGGQRHPDRRTGRPDPGQSDQQRGHTANQHQQRSRVTQASLASGAGGTMTLTVQVSSGSGSITNAASADQHHPRPDPRQQHQHHGDQPHRQRRPAASPRRRA